MKNLYIISILLIAFLSSCTEKIDFELNDESNNKLVVEGSITTEVKAHRVKLTRTASYFYNKKAITASGAKVVISTDNAVFNLTEKEPGIYETNSDVAGVIGKTYTLTIDFEGQHYEAKSKINRISEMDSITYKYFDNAGFNHDTPPEDELDGPVYKLYFFGPEIPSPTDDLKDYYMWEYYVDGKLETDTLSKKRFVDDMAVDGNYIHDWNFFTVKSSKIQNDITKIKFKMYSIPKEYYKFWEAVMIETKWNGGIFDGPPANVPSNISNGAYGIFYAASVKTLEIEVKKKK